MGSGPSLPHPLSLRCHPSPNPVPNPRAGVGGTACRGRPLWAGRAEIGHGEDLRTSEPWIVCGVSWRCCSGEDGEGHLNSNTSGNLPAPKGKLDRNTSLFSTTHMSMALEIVIFMLKKMTVENLSIGYVMSHWVNFFL